MLTTQILRGSLVGCALSSFLEVLRTWVMIILLGVRGDQDLTTRLPEAKEVGFVISK